MTMTEKRSDNPTTKVLYADSGGSKRRWALIGLSLAVIAAVVVAVVLTTGGGSTKPAKHASTTPTAKGTTQTTLSPYALNNNPAPLLSGAYSDNLKTAFLALYAYHDWAFEHPSSTLPSRYAVIGSPDYKIELYNIEYLVAHHAHAPNDPRGLDGDIQYAKVTLAPKPVLAANGKQELRSGHPAFQGGIVTVVATYLPSNFYNSAGQYVQPGQRAGASAIAYSLIQGSDGQWRLYQATVLHPPGGPQSVEQ
jgi:hypothetical protein